MTSDSPTREQRANARNALLAGFLGWTLDAFDYFILVFVLVPVAREFHKTVPEIALTLTASLAMRPVGALIFGLMADRYGRRPVLLSGLALFLIGSAVSAAAGRMGL